MNRLVQTIQDGKTERYTYDLAGNRLRKESSRETEVYQYNAKNQLTSLRAGDTTTRYRYDPQGNLLEERGDTWTKRYTYDAANRQTGIELTGLSETTPGCFRQVSRYDGEGLRYETEENGKTICFLYDRGELAEEAGEDSHTSYTRGYAPLVLTRNGAERSYFVPDEIGSTLFLLGKDHEIQKTYRYDAFGVIKEETGEIPNRLTFTGQMYDGETGQYYLRARFYNPSIGRFTQEDIYRGDGLNLYAYCANNPVGYYDPYGLAKKQLLCVGGKTAAQCETFDEVQYFMRVRSAPPDDHGTWVSGIRGEGLFIPSDKRILDLLINEYGVTGVWYTHGVPDFSPFTVETYLIKNMQGGKKGRDYNFGQADEYMASIYGVRKGDFARARSDMGYTWHECNDMITMQMIPKDINNYFWHLGGVGEINLLNQQSIKSTWKKFPNWKK